MTEPLRSGSEATHVAVEDKLRAAGITPTIEAVQAYRLGVKAGPSAESGNAHGRLTIIKWHPKPCPDEMN